MLKTTAKSVLKRTSLFPVARLAFRRFNPSIVALRHREIRLYRGLLAKDSLVFDVGANLGQKSEIFIASGFRTIVIEPNRHCQAALNAQFAKTPRAIIVQKAVGRASGHAELFADGSDAAASVLADWHTKIYGSPVIEPPQLVEVMTLDQLIAEYGRPDYIKIDVEGYENEVLLGLSEPVKLLSFEFHHEMTDATVACLNTLSRFGWSFMMRLSDMHGHWMSPTTNDISTILQFISRTKSNGDVYVWLGQ